MVEAKLKGEAMEALTQDDYKRTYQMLDGVNSSGIARDLVLMIDKIRTEGLSTSEVNKHPIVVCFACKLAELAGCSVTSTYGSDAYMDAISIVKEKAGL